MRFCFRLSSPTLIPLTLTVLLAPALLTMLISPSVWAETTNSAPSILRPAGSQVHDYRFPVNAVDPTAASNPKGADTPGFRGEGQLVLYTPAFGTMTGTNAAGTEAVVVDGVITQSGGANSPIPANGFVISGHGAAAQWMNKFAKPGALAAYDAATGQLSITFTPAVYLNQVDVALARAKARPPADADAYRAHLAQAEHCRADLATQAGQGISPTLVGLAGRCEREADRAFYNTVQAHPQEFRGTWIRPDNLDPAKIQQTIAQMKRLGVDNIFLETYYQGETIYPSRVMADYGLPTQHPQFKGGDPLQLWIDAAHQAGLKVHVWTQVFFAGNQRENAELYGPILQKYPQWRNIERPNWNNPLPFPSEVEPGHYFLDPANPEVRAFLEKLLLEMVSRYDIDGLNLDYIRYPASTPVSSGLYLSTTWGYTDAARTQFQALITQEREVAEQKRLDALKLAGKPIPPEIPLKTPPPSIDPKDLTPQSPLWPRWISWRKDRVSTFVQTISQKTHALKPKVLISAVIFPSTDSTYAQKLQDYPRWASEGWIQALTPIGLSTIPERMYSQALKLKEQVQDRIPINVGVFALYNRQDPIELVRQIDTLHQADMAGIMLFDWTRLNADYEDALKEGPFRPSVSPQ